MGFSWKDFGKTIGLGALDIVGQLIPAVGAVESIAKTLPGLKGSAKQDAAIELVKDSLAAAETITGRDLLNDAEVEAATRDVVDAVVRLHNIVEAAKAAKAAKTPGVVVA